MMSIRCPQKKEGYLAVEYKSKELKTEILAEMDHKITALATQLPQQMNENHQIIAIHLREINDLVVTV